MTSHCPVSWYLRSMACFCVAHVAPRLGASGAALPGHRRGLNEARKNAAGNQRRNEVRCRFGHDGFERGYRDSIRLPVDSFRRQLSMSPSGFRAFSIWPSSLAVFDGERGCYAFQRHPRNQ
jgi:hypothetical protein